MVIEEHAGIGPVAPRPAADLAHLLAWLRTGEAVAERVDFPAGTALPDGRLDLCKQDLGPQGAALVAGALRPGPVKHLLLGTDGLGDAGAARFATAAVGISAETLYLGCNGITPRGAHAVADGLRASPQALSGVWLKRNPLGTEGGSAAAGIIDAVTGLRSLDLVQTGLDATGLGPLADAVVAAHAAGRGLERLYVGGNPFGPAGAEPLARIVAAGAVGELYVSAAGLGDAGAFLLAEVLGTAPRGALRRLSLASNGIGPDAAARVVEACAAAGVEALDLGRVLMARPLGALGNRLDEAAARRVGTALAARPHELSVLVLSQTGLDSRSAKWLLEGARRAVSPTRFMLGKGIARTIRRELTALAASVPEREIPPGVTAIRSVHRTAAEPPE
ncbi:gala protein [Phytomonospora sp. NPDC050363]|uniref:gala protein n=1 Tax=Phytomonospora sp. NPDC050363 TaxID=3155642 RepID=UPI0033E22415